MDSPLQFLAAGSPEVQNLLVQLFLIFLAALIGGEIAMRLKMPAVVGEILAGVCVGPSVLGWIPVDDGMAPLPFEVLSEIGVVFLMFAVGLETRLSALRQLGKVALSVAVLGVIAPFALGFGWAELMGYDHNKSFFIATAFVATSVGITARVLADMGKLDARPSKVILAAAVLDDILAMMMLAAAIALMEAQGTGGGGAFVHVAIIAAQAVILLLMLTVFLPMIVRKHHRVIEMPLSPHSPFALAIALCIGVAVLAGQIGLAAIIGAFLAGTLLSEIGEKYDLEHQLKPLLFFLTPFFFVVTGMKVDLSVFHDSSVVINALVVTVLAIIGKVVGCSLGALKLGKREALAIGVGMTPRGEVGIIIAALGLSSGAFQEEMYAIIIAMSLLTSIIAPPFLAMLMKSEKKKTTTSKSE